MVGKPVFFNGGELLLRQQAGQRWDEGNMYASLVKHAYVPDLSDTTRGDLSNFCDSANYAEQDIANRTFINGNLLCNPIDFTSSGVNIMTCRYMIYHFGNFASPDNADANVCYIDLVEEEIDGLLNAAIQMDANGIIRYVVV